MVIDLKDTLIEILDGTATPLVTEAKIGEGTLSWTEKRNIQYIKNRGLLYQTREGDQEPMDVRLDFLWEHLIAHTGDTQAVTPYEAIKNVGAASTWKTTGAACEPYAVDIRITFTPPCASDKAEIILIQDYRYESIAADAKAGTVSTTGKANVTAPTITRAT